jgi:hypothetical protein
MADLAFFSIILAVRNIESLVEYLFLWGQGHLCQFFRSDPNNPQQGDNNEGRVLARAYPFQAHSIAYQFGERFV